MSMKHSNSPVDVARFAPLADIAKTLATPQRLALLELVQQGEKSVEHLAEHTGLSVSNTSQHLQQLRRAGCVLSRRAGKHIFYRASEGPLAAVVAALQAYVDFQHETMRQALVDSRNQNADMEQVTVQELLRRMQDGTVVLLDVRPQAEFAAAHVPGAINLPVDELTTQLASHLQKLPANVPIVAYCRDPYCVLSVEAVHLLKAQGQSAQRLIGGIAQWIAAGMQVDTGQ